MARKYDKEKINLNPLKNLKEETRQAIFAVTLFVLAVFFVLSSLQTKDGFSKAGPAGEMTYKIFEMLFGIGYYFVPIVLVILGISILMSLKKNLAVTQTIGSVLMFFSALAIIEITFPDNAGGLIGKGISLPLIKLFEITATYIALGALFLISTFVVFDSTLSVRFIPLIWKKIFGKKEVDLENEPAKEMRPAEIKIAQNESKEIDQPKPIEEKKEVGTIKKIFSGNEEKENEFGFKPMNIGTGKEFVPPPLSLLERDKGKPGVGDIKANANIIQRTLLNFGIVVEMDEISIGPSVTRYALKPAEGVKLSRIVALQNDLALALAAHPIRIEAPIPGKSLVGIEIPNSTKTTVGLGTLLSAEEYQQSDKPILVGLGKVISGKSHFANLAKMPHLLIAGATGSGKSVTIHSVITSLLYRNSPEQLKFIMIDPKRVELTLYNKIPHLLTPVITDPKKAILALKWAAKEMDRRYDILEGESVRDIDSYHKTILQPELKKMRENKLPKNENGDVKVPETMPYIVVIIDELADIMQSYPRELEGAIVRLAQMSRAVGIHLILSTQRPSVNVITGLIKANVPSRIALQVSSQIDSRTILDASGAEKLLGAGDMLYMSGDMSKPQRIQSAYISETEVKNVVKYLADQYQDEIPQEIDLDAKNDKNAIFESSIGDGEDDDELYEEAREIVIGAGKASTSFLQRKLRIGYARAARLIDMLEERGVVGAGSGAKPRDVIGADTNTEDVAVDTSTDEQTNQG
jgi:S-DNA-T family DNA segregation ATPase FtsK/SpoIIIE